MPEDTLSISALKEAFQSKGFTYVTTPLCMYTHSYQHLLEMVLFLLECYSASASGFSRSLESAHVLSVKFFSCFLISLQVLLWIFLGTFGVGLLWLGHRSWSPSLVHTHQEIKDLVIPICLTIPTSRSFYKSLGKMQVLTLTSPSIMDSSILLIGKHFVYACGSIPCCNCVG